MFTKMDSPTRWVTHDRIERVLLPVHCDALPKNKASKIQTSSLTVMDGVCLRADADSCLEERLADLHLFTSARRDFDAENASDQSDTQSTETEEGSVSAFESYIRGVVGNGARMWWQTTFYCLCDITKNRSVATTTKCLWIATETLCAVVPFCTDSSSV